MSHGLGMHEMACDKCRKIICFSNRGYYKHADSPMKIECVECYFMSIRENQKK